MKIKRFSLLLIVGLLAFSPFNVVAASSAAPKDEVIYSTLQSNGEELDMYVVNSFEVEGPGELVDYGDYTSIKNLTDLSEITKEDDTISFTASEDSFYYQGNLENNPLPWEFDISYQLDGEEMTPEEMLGQDGHLQIGMETSANEEVNPIFFENYLLQISLTLDTERYQEIEAEDGTIANAGKDKQVTFTVMPEKEESFLLEADVTDFELKGIEISAVPSSMSIDSPEVDDVTEDFETLSDATTEIDDGVGELADGISELNSGVSSLKNGSSDYQDGITQISNGSADLISGSESIDQALVTMKDSIDQDVETGDFSALQEGLEQIARGLREASNGLTTLQENYTQAYDALDESINAIPSYDISEEEIQALYQSGAESEVVDKLVETYEAALTAKGTYDQVSEAFAAVAPTLDEVSSSQTDMATSLETMAEQIAAASEGMDIQEGLKELQEGLATLSDNYKEFHAGLEEYTNGVDELSNAYQDLHNGIVELEDGTSSLENGVGELHDGTTELADSTSDLPDQMQDEIDEMINDYDKSDFDAVSFVSDKNENVQSVQFVIKTESITQDEEDDEEEETEEEKSFWDRLLDLFR
ncbi:YhgE/Pip domain-containing protein [Gracilibacillus salitolerans]|uniref:YhgE/Pip domain-containing protein n=1 Tax=Gracilibacillus salitolerans TaxID=2663022 RepID=A0A5Q2TKR5_9BACI|nr:YhgE/Pip domain-containing protein [Gracilibacillus salitolerans]QGH35544.1 YhgE/Pip domain-containing protein [Gracilibacillus salitolerans]